MAPRSDFLYARPSFIEGMARILDFGNTLSEYNTSSSPDRVALAMDLAMVGEYLRNSMSSYDQEAAKEKSTCTSK